MGDRTPTRRARRAASPRPRPRSRGTRPQQQDTADDLHDAGREEARQQRHGRWHPDPFEGAVAVRGIPEGVDDAVPLADAHDRRNRETAEPQSVDDAIRASDPQAPGRRARHEVRSRRIVMPGPPALNLTAYVATPRAGRTGRAGHPDPLAHRGQQGRFARPALHTFTVAPNAPEGFTCGPGSFRLGSAQVWSSQPAMLPAGQGEHEHRSGSASRVVGDYGPKDLGSRSCPGSSTARGQVSTLGFPAGSGTSRAGGCAMATVRVDKKVAADVHQLARGKHPPAALPVEFLRRDHHRGNLLQPGRVHRRGGAAHVQARTLGAGRPLQDVQGVLAGVTQRPQLTGRGHDRVQRRTPAGARRSTGPPR